MQPLLLAWYGENRANLPWRHTHDPYAILVSEVMLQQTQVARVVDRWTAWLERWPDAASLAGATPAEVLQAWQGMGYNRRALNLHRASRVVAADGWPTTYDGLRTLPGVGPYTAAALAVQAFGADLLPVLRKQGLHLGEMSIFHRHADVDGNGQVMFSMANMVKPGTFNVREVAQSGWLCSHPNAGAGDADGQGVVTSSACFHSVALRRRDDYVREVARVAKPGATVLVFAFGPWLKWPGSRRTREP